MTGPTSAMEPVEPQSLKKLSFKSLKRALDLFSPLHAHFLLSDPASKKMRMSHKFSAKYGGIKSTSSQPLNHAKSGSQDQAREGSGPSNALALPGPENSKDPQNGGALIDLIVGPTVKTKGLDGGLSEKSIAIVSASSSSERNFSTSAIMERIPSRWPRPVWHAPWKNYRVISGHLGWVRSIAFDPSNTWFCTGSADRTIKIWDVGTGRLKLTLTGHIEQVRGLAVSNKDTYMFSAGDDKQVKCWDLEQNKVIRSYHGHLSGVYCLALHPTLDVLLTGGRDSVCRLWDIRSKVQIYALSGHENTVCSVFTRPTDPQVITGSHDTTIRLWDLRYVKRTATLTHHKKSVRAMALHPTKNCFASASADNIKKFNLPEGEFMHNMLSQQKTIINAMAVNEDGVMVTGDQNRAVLTWKQRLQIAIDAAQALEYLHNGCKPPIIHRDIKTTNTLLTENLQAKVADFGLSRIFPAEDGSHVSTAVVGTFGYLDPESWRKVSKPHVKSSLCQSRNLLWTPCFPLLRRL